MIACFGRKRSAVLNGIIAHKSSPSSYELNRYLTRYFKTFLFTPSLLTTIVRFIYRKENLVTYTNSFAVYLEVERGRSPTTIKAYLGDISRFRIWLDIEAIENGLAPTWEEVTDRHVRAYLASLGDEHKRASPRYVRRIISSLRTWFDYLTDVEKIDMVNPARAVAKPKLPKRHANALTSGEVARLVQAARDYSQRAEKVRNWTAIAFLYATGLRISEFVNMKEDDIRRKDGLPSSVRVIGKGNKERRVPLSAEASAALHQWLRERRHLLADLPPGSDSDFIWLILTGFKRGQHWGAQGVRKMLKTYAPLAGIKKNVYPHMLRHTCGNEMVRSGVRLDVVQKLFGHADVSTTIIYTHADERDLEEAVAGMPRIL